MRLYISQSKIDASTIADVLKREQPALILIDLDDTISPRNTYRVNKSEREVLEKMKSQAKVCLVTNNSSDEKCAKLAKELGIDYVYITGSLFTRKPFPSKVREIIQSYGLSGDSVLFVGDKVLTDAGCALTSGCASCLLVDGINGSAAASSISKNLISKLPNAKTINN